MTGNRSVPPQAPPTQDLPTQGPPSQMLDGITVLDFTRVLAGPHATRLMADLGARIIKIERPGEGDEMRRAPAPLPGDGDQSTYFARRNAGKQSIAIDLSSEAGRELIHALVPHVDVAIENFMPGVADKLGCGYETLAAIKPDLVYCSVSGYGQTGPNAKQGAFAHVVSAASGLMHLDARADGPRNSHLQAADVLAGSNAFGAVMAALWRRDKTGQGAHIDVSMLESLIASEDISFGSVPNGVPSVPGPRPGMGLSRVDGQWLAWQSGGAPGLWDRLCALMDTPELLTHPDFATAELRRDNWEPLQEHVSRWLGALDSRADALAALRGARIPCAPVLTPEEVVQDPQIQSREAFTAVPHGDGSEVIVTSSPYWLDGQAVRPVGPAPYRIGEHTRSVLKELLDYDDKMLATLVDAGVISAPQ